MPIPDKELMPCPFCGGDARELIDMRPMWSRQVYGCERCKIARGTIEAWNTRPSPTPSEWQERRPSLLDQIVQTVTSYVQAESKNVIILDDERAKQAVALVLIEAIEDDRP
jgi:transcriptional regulator NrdR family protein